MVKSPARILPWPVLVTRPEPQASRFAADLAGRFGDAVQPVLTPLMQTRFLDAHLPADPAAAVIFTSEAAVAAAVHLRVGGAVLPHRAYCVGSRTAQTALEAGFTATSADGNAQDLLAHIRAQQPQGPLLYLHGRDIAVPLADLLAAAGLPTHAVTVYDQFPCGLTEPAARLLDRDADVIVPLFSARSVQLFLDALGGRPKARLHLCLISKNLLTALPADLQPRAICAEYPRSAAMLDLVGRVMSS